MNKIKEKLTMFALMAPVLATDNVNLAAPTGFTELGKITFNNLVTGGVKLVLVAAALIFFFILIVGGIRWILSGGDENKVKEARAQITNALIGLAIVFLAWAIAALINSLFGVNITGGLDLPSFNTTTVVPE